MTTPFEAYQIAVKNGSPVSAELEECIFTASNWAYYYSLNIIHGRYLKAESIILTDPGWSYYYAKNVIKGPWQECEQIILNDVKYTFLYVTNILKRKWDDAHDILINSEYEVEYKKFIDKIEALSKITECRSKIKILKDEIKLLQKKTI